VRAFDGLSGRRSDLLGDALHHLHDAALRGDVVELARVGPDRSGRPASTSEAGAANLGSRRPRTGLCLFSNRSLGVESGNWKNKSRDWRRKPCRFGNRSRSFARQRLRITRSLVLTSGNVAGSPTRGNDTAETHWLAALEGFEPVYVDFGPVCWRHFQANKSRQHRDDTRRNTRERPDDSAAPAPPRRRDAEHPTSRTNRERAVRGDVRSTLDGCRAMSGARRVSHSSSGHRVVYSITRTSARRCSG
jgi:hypothetical protein